MTPDMNSSRAPGADDAPVGSPVSLTLRVNEQGHTLVVQPSKTLLELLREDLGLMGAREACDTGGCGACTVLVDDLPVYSCMVLALDCRDKSVLTIEGLAQDGRLHALQQAFIDHGAIQCGFCTPGMVLTAKALLDVNPNPTEQEVREAISGNICRCTGYVKIVEAIMAVAQGSTE